MPQYESSGSQSVIKPEAFRASRNSLEDASSIQAALEVRAALQYNPEFLSSSLQSAVEHSARYAKEIDSKACSVCPVRLYLNGRTGKILGIITEEDINRVKHGAKPIGEGKPRLGIEIETLADPDAINITVYYAMAPAKTKVFPDGSGGQIFFDSPWSRSTQIVFSSKQKPSEKIADPIARGVFLKSVEVYNTHEESPIVNVDKDGYIID